MEFIYSPEKHSPSIPETGSRSSFSTSIEGEVRTGSSQLKTISSGSSLTPPSSPSSLPGGGDLKGERGELKDDVGGEM
jgi:hypothetical protein